MEPWRAVDAHKGVIEAQNGPVERLYNSQIRTTLMGAGSKPHQS